MSVLCALVARPTSTSSRPVANGSSVPAWPVRAPPSARRTAATTSCEVMPAGLSTSRTPSCARPRSLMSRARARARRADERRGGGPGGGGVQLRGDRLAQERDQLLGLERGREPRRAAVPAAALRAGDDGDVDVVVGGAQGHFALALALAAGELAHERRDLGALERAQLVDDALGVALLGLRA